MRTPKKEKTVLENLMKNTWFETKNGTEISTNEQKIVLKAIHATLHYFARLFVRNR